MDLMRINVMLLYVSFIVFVLDEYSECTTHPRVKMYGPKVTVIDRRKPETKIGPDIDNEVNVISQPAADMFLNEPSCLELRIMWRTSQRRNQLAQSAANRLPLAFDPFAFNAWDDYVKPRYINRQMMFERTMPADRFQFYRQLRPFDKIAHLTSATARAVVDDQLSRKANLFRLGYPVAKVPVHISMRLMTKDRFEELKEMVRHEKAKFLRHRSTTAADNDNTFSVMPIVTSGASDDNTAGKKRPPGYESLMSRPRHFSQGHYMNVKPNGEGNIEIDGGGVIATVSAQEK